MTTLPPTHTDTRARTGTRTGRGRRGPRLLTAGASLVGLVGLGVAVVPQAGASGLDGTARATATTRTTQSCIGCLDRTYLGFEDGRLGGWTGTNGAKASVSSAFPKSGSKSLAVDKVMVGSGAQALITQRTGAAYFGLSVALAPSSTSGQSTATSAERTWVMLTMTTPGRQGYAQIEEVREGVWTTLGSWAQPLQDGLLMDVRVVQTCGSTTTRRLFIDDIQIATPGGSGAYGQAVPAAAARTGTTSDGRTTTGTTSTTEPACLGSTVTPTISDTPVSYPKEFSFEGGTREGWKPIQGVSAKIVSDPTPVDGAKVLELKGTKASYAGLTWTGRTSAFPGSGPWYRVMLPVRGPRTTSTATTGNPSQVMLSVSGPVGSSVGGITSLPSDGSWAVADLFFTLADSAGTKPATITLTLGPAPQPDCGVSTPPARVLAVDGITFTRKAWLPASTQAVVAPMC